MRPAATTVVGGWAAANAVLATILVLYREMALAIGLYAGSVVLLAVLAAVVYARRGDPPVRQDFPLSGGAACTGGIALGLLGLGLIYRFAILLALPLLVLTLELAVREARRRP